LSRLGSNSHCPYWLMNGECQGTLCDDCTDFQIEPGFGSVGAGYGFATMCLTVLVHANTATYQVHTFSVHTSVTVVGFSSCDGGKQQCANGTITQHAVFFARAAASTTHPPATQRACDELCMLYHRRQPARMRLQPNSTGLQLLGNCQL
jgi:hypothetical protein